MRSLMILLATLLLASCTMLPADVEPWLDDGDDESARDDLVGKGDSLGATSTYYSVRADERQCAWPQCGGLLVKRVNRTSTRCDDGKYWDECYVAEHDLTALGLSEAENARLADDLARGLAVVRGSIRRQRVGGSGKLGRLVVTEAWRATTADEPSGKFYRVTDRGLSCFTFPCFTLHQDKLNAKVGRELSGLSGSDELGESASSMLPAEPVLVAGENQVVADEGPAGDGLHLVMSQVYTRVVPEETPAEPEP